MNFLEYPDREMAALDVADALAGDLENALFNHDTVTLAVPGGGTPGPIFSVLCAVDLDWSRVCVLPTDERWVPEDHPRSNARLIRERLLTGRAAAAQFLSFHGDGVDPDATAAALAPVVQAKRALSVLFLGMGTDMHTASLFPGADGLSAALDPHAPAVAVTRPAGQPEPRITLTAPVLKGAMSKHLVIFGTDKRAALEKAAHLPPEQAPIRAALQETTVHWAE